MPTVKFQPSPYREAAMQDLREGMTPKECAAKYHVSERTAWRWLKETKEGPRQVTLQAIKPARSKPVRIHIELGSADFAKLLAFLRHREEQKAALENAREVSNGK